MYTSYRMMRVNASRVTDAVGAASWVVGALNERHGGQLSVSVNVGTDPGLIVVAGRYESLARYGEMRAALAADAEIQGGVRMVADLALPGSIQDTLTKVLVQPGDPQAMAVTNVVRVHMPRITEAVGLGVEIADYVLKLTGRPVGLSTVVTGDRSRLLFSGFYSDMADVQALGDQTEGDAGYMDFFARSAGIFVDGSLEQSIWQIVA